MARRKLDFSYRRFIASYQTVAARTSVRHLDSCLCHTLTYAQRNWAEALGFVHVDACPYVPRLLSAKDLNDEFTAICQSVTVPQGAWPGRQPGEHSESPTAPAPPCPSPALGSPEAYAGIPVGRRGRPRRPY